MPPQGQQDLQALIDALRKFNDELIKADSNIDKVQRNDPQLFRMLDQVLKKTGSELDQVKLKFSELFELLQNPPIQPGHMRYIFSQILGGMQNIRAPGAFNPAQAAAFQNLVPQVQSAFGTAPTGQASNMQGLVNQINLRMGKTAGGQQQGPTGTILDYQLSPQQLNQYLDAIQPMITFLKTLGVTATDVSTKLVQAADGTWKFASRIEDSTGQTRTLNQVLTQSGQIIDEFTYKQTQADAKMAAQQAARRPATFEELYKGRFGGLGAQVVGQKTTDIGTLVGTLQPSVDLFNKLGISIDKMDVKVDQLSDGFTRFRTTLQSDAGVIQTVNAYLSQTGQVLDEVTYKTQRAAQARAAQRPATFQQIYSGQFPGLSQQVIGQSTADMGTLVGALGPARDLFNRLGVAIDKTGVSVKKMDDGFLQFTTTLQSDTGLIQKVNAYLSQTGQVLDEVAYKAQKVAQVGFTPESLARSLGADRAQRALGIAEKRGFTPEQLKSVETQEPSGVSILKFQARDAEGVVQRLEVVIDRFGKVLTRTNRRLLGFFDSIVRNTGELIKWSVGIGLVYGSYYRFQELLKVAIDNQAKLADVTISLGEAQRDVNDIFQDAAKVAAETGENINAVLETYTMAYRAVGGIEDPLKRTTAANQLLTDATILNKLSSLEAADSIDVLSGALRQLQRPEEDVATAFQRGTELLDKWVAVTRRANVDLATLATAFSITAESAENAGASLEEINAIIAVISEKIGGLGGRETGNAVRALIGGLYQQQGADLLARYGIAVEDTTGKMRPFLEVSRDIYELYQSGIIDETQLNKIGYTLGGGVRRGQQYVAFLSDFARVQEVVNAQTDSQGSAQDALNIKVNTLQTSITELSNAFQSLAQTMGTDGGALDTMDGFLSTITSIVEFVDKLVESLGTLTIPAALLTFAHLYFGRGDIGKARWGNLGERFGGAVYGGITGFAPFNQQQNMIFPGMAQAGQRFGSWAGLKAGQYGPAIGLGAIPAIGRAAQGQWGAAGAEIFGAFLGAALTGGSPIGGLIGASMVEAFVGGMEEAKGEISDVLVSPFREEVPELLKLREKELLTQEEEIQLDVSEEGRRFMSDWASAFEATIINFIGRYPTTTPEGGLGLAQLKEGEKISDYQLRVLRARETVEAAEAGTPIPIERLKQAQEFLKEVDRLAQFTPEVVEFEDSTFKQMQDQFKEIFGDYVRGISDAQREELRTNLLAGDISVKEFRGGLETAQGLSSALSRILITVTKDLDGTLDATEENRRAMEEWADILAKATPENKQALNSLVSQFVELSRALDEVKDKADGTMTDFNGDTVDAIWLMDELGKVSEEVIMILDNMSAAQEKARLDAIQLPSIFGGFEGINFDELSMLEQDARRMQEEWFREYATVTPDVNFSDLEQKALDAEPIFVYLGTVLGYAVLEGFLGTEFLQKAYDAAIEEGKIADKNAKVGFQAFDISSGQFMNQIMPQYNAMLQRLMAAGYTPDYSTLVPIFSDGVKDAMSLDWKIVQYLLQQILDTEKKQLDGIYNLPAEGTFWVPQQTLEMARNLGYNEAVEAMGGGGGGLGGLLGGLQEPVGDVSRERWNPEEDVRGPTKPLELKGLPELGAGAWWEDRLKKEDLTPSERFLSRIADNTEYLKQLEDKQNINYPEEKARMEDSDYLDQLKVIEDFRALNQPQAGPTDTIDTSTGELRVKDITLLAEVSTIRNLVQTVFGTRGTGGTGLFDNTNQAAPQTMFVPTAPTDNRPIQTDLNIDINSQIQLVVDGRTLADIVKPYLYHDLIRWEGSGGAVNTAVTV